MVKDKEIEIKLIYKDKDKVVEKLKEIGAVFRESYDLEDYYFTLMGKEMSNKNDLLLSEENMNIFKMQNIIKL